MLDRHLCTARPLTGLPSGGLHRGDLGAMALPISTNVSWSAIAGLLAVHVPLGVAFSYAWRPHCNLVLPAFGHALGRRDPNRPDSPARLLRQCRRGVERWYGNDMYGCATNPPPAGQAGRYRWIRHTRDGACASNN